MLRWYILKAIHRPPSSDLILKWMNIFRITVATEEQQPWTDWKGPVVDKALCRKLCKVGGPLPTGGNIGKRLRHEASPFKQVFVIIFIINQLWTSKYQKDNTLYLNGRCEKIVTQSSWGSFDMRVSDEMCSSIFTAQQQFKILVTLEELLHIRCCLLTPVPNDNQLFVSIEKDDFLSYVLIQKTKLSFYDILKQRNLIIYCFSNA